MPQIISVSSVNPPFKLQQEEIEKFVETLFTDSFKDIHRLLKVFKTSDIHSRYFVKDLSWFQNVHSFSEKNDEYIYWSTKLGVEAIRQCLNNKIFLHREVAIEEIDAIFFISSTGISTPSIEARIMNELPFSSNTKRIPIWGLGCAGGVSGLARAYEYCKAFPKAKVIVLTIELCSLTFQRNDHSKSNLIGSALFADGVACTLVCGDEASPPYKKGRTYPMIVDTLSVFMPHSTDVMGWDVKDEGLYVVFSKDIPSIIRNHFKEQVEIILEKNGLSINNIDYFIAHPGGKKVLDAYHDSLNLPEDATNVSRNILRNYGNMSSATVIYVLRKFMMENVEENKLGLACALGPGFSSELLLVRWAE